MIDKSIKNYKFDITKYNIGDTFLGCQICFWQLDPNQAAKPICPKCSNKLYLYTLTECDKINIKEPIGGKDVKMGKQRKTK